jgi:undecaprenyl-diphosphatase
MVLFSSEPFWAIILGVVLLIVHLRRNMLGIRFIWLALGALGLSDLFAYRVLKPFVARLRPCYEFTKSVRLVPVGCGSDYGFPSNHAANSMAIATIAICLLGRKTGGSIFLIALVIGFSRVYLGVHFPGDVICGFLVGAAAALALLGSEKRLLGVAQSLFRHKHSP